MRWYGSWYKGRRNRLFNKKACENCVWACLGLLWFAQLFLSSASDLATKHTLAMWFGCYSDRFFREISAKVNLSRESRSPRSTTYQSASKCIIQWFRAVGTIGDVSIGAISVQFRSFPGTKQEQNRNWVMVSPRKIRPLYAKVWRLKSTVIYFLLSMAVWSDILNTFKNALNIWTCPLRIFAVWFWWIPSYPI